MELCFGLSMEVLSHNAVIVFINLSKIAADGI